MCYPNFSYMINKHDELETVNDGLCGHSEIESPHVDVADLERAIIMARQQFPCPTKSQVVKYAIRQQDSRWRGEYDWVKREHIIEDHQVTPHAMKIPRWELNPFPPAELSNSAWERIKRAERDRFSDPEKFIRWLDQDKDGMPLIVWDYHAKKCDTYIDRRYGPFGKELTALRMFAMCALPPPMGDDIVKHLLKWDPTLDVAKFWRFAKEDFLESDKNRIEAWKN